MATNISNHSSEKMMWNFHSVSECIPWLVVLITECLAIVILNIITIIVFVKKRQLRRRSTYLIIHLAIVDLLAGAVSGPLQIEIAMAYYCNIWPFSWKVHALWYVKDALRHLFSFTSIGNLAAISVERLHATFCPFRHRFVKKRVYIVIIIVMWLTTTAREGAQIVLKEVTGSHLSGKINHILYLPFYLISLFVICVSYILTVIKVRCSRHPQFHGATKRQRKLTGTSIIVALVSFLCLLPIIVTMIGFHSYLGNRLLPILYYMFIIVAFMGNSLINPVIYAMRMPGFRAGVSQIFCGARKRIIVPVDLPLRDLRRG